jgi:hypothetical protein
LVLEKGFLTDHEKYRPMELIFKAWNKKKHVVGVFCDLTKASDCVNHELLVCKLQFYGVKDTLLQWFTSYLISRKQWVHLKSSTSLTDVQIGKPLYMEFPNSWSWVLIPLVYISIIPTLLKKDL